MKPKILSVLISKLLASFLAALALLLPATAHAEWMELKTEHFAIYGNKSEKDLKKFAERLEAVHYLMLASDGLKDEKKPYRVSIYLIGSIGDVQDLANNSNAAGFYRPNAAGAMAVVPSYTTDRQLDRDVILYHEYAHHFMLQYFTAAYPAWYVEGRAELLSTASFEKNGYISYGKVADHRRYSFENTRWIPVDVLLTGDPAQIDKKYPYARYPQSWLLTHYLTFSDERKGQLGKYLRAINKGVPFDKAAAAFGDLDQLDRELRKYLRDANFSYKQPKLPKNILGKYTLRTLRDAEIALIDDRLEFYRYMKTDEAEKFLKNIREKVARYPNDPYALLLLAEVELDSKNYAEANAAADRLLKVSPKSARALWIKGRVGIDSAQELDDEERDRAIADARSWIVKARAADKNDPLPMIAYYDSYIEAGENPTEKALDALIAAHYIVPQDTAVRFKLASALISRGYKDDAVHILKPVAFSPHGGDASNQARKLIASIDPKYTLPENVANNEDTEGS